MEFVSSLALPTLSCNTWPTGGGKQTFFSASDLPAVASYTAGESSALGVRMTMPVPGLITAVRFLKALNEPGTGHQVGLDRRRYGSDLKD